MNASDAAKLASELDVKLAVPVHFGMLDNLDATIFAYKNKMIPEIYKEMEL
jgi:L-ascorbate metabolism protein UlaG (beta-lactamase superfamily)